MSGADAYLGHDLSEDSDAGSGYDSEAAEVSKSRSAKNIENNGRKRRKLSHSSQSQSEADEEVESDDEANDASFVTAADHLSPIKRSPLKKSPVKKLPAITERLEPVQLQPRGKRSRDDPERLNESDVEDDTHGVEIDYKIKSASGPAKLKKSSKPEKKEKKPGVIYLSSLPPYLKPSALRNLLQQRGFEPITRLFLTPASKHKHSSKKNSRQLYTEGWIEFASKKTARRCAEALNAQLVGGNKRGFYYDDLWNMKYLKGMQWDELMAGIREERREEEGRRDEERRKVAAETKAFIEGVEQAKRLDGMKRKRNKKSGRDDDTAMAKDGVQREWLQYESVGQGASNGSKAKKEINQDVQNVLSQI